MITVLSSPKHGSGTSTTAALLAIAASANDHTVLIDLAGDQAALFNVPTIDGTIHMQPRLDLINAAEMSLVEQIATIHEIDHRRCHVIIDAGSDTHPIHHHLPDAATTVWVIRPCYLALRLAARTVDRPDQLIVLAEVGRTLNQRDIEATLNVRVAATIDVHPEIARAADAGLLSSRPPRRALRSLQAIVRADDQVAP